MICIAIVVQSITFDIVMKTQTKKSLLKKVQKKNGCWNFTGAISKLGYGVVGYAGKVWGAHRLMQFFTHGEIPVGLFVCHRCDNRKCINPEHLFLGTAKDNTQDMISKGRRKGGRLNGRSNTCIKGHSKLDPSNVYVNPDGYLRCKTCVRKLYLLKKTKTN